MNNMVASPLSTDILRSSLELVCDQLNRFLNTIAERVDAWAMLTNLVDHAGGVNQAARNKVVMTVYGMTREDGIRGAAPARGAPSSSSGGAYPVIAPPLYLDVRLMVLANFVEDRYVDGLTALSRTISFFQQTPVLTRGNAPTLDPALDKLTLDFEELDPVDVNYVMGMCGTRYLPSAFYRMRMLPFVSGAMTARSYPVTGPAGGVSAS